MEMQSTSCFRVLCVLMIAGLVILGGSGVGSAASATAVAIIPEQVALSDGDAQTFEIVVEEADNGVGAFEINVTLATVRVASITNASVGGDPGLDRVEIGNDNSTLHIAAALMDTNDTGSVRVATFTIRAEGSGTTAIDLEVDAIGDEAGSDYHITAARGAQLTVESDSPTPTPTATGTQTPPPTEVTSPTPTATDTPDRTPQTQTPRPTQTTQTPPTSTTRTTSVGEATATETPISPANAETLSSTQTDTLIPTPESTAIQVPAEEGTVTTATTPGFGISIGLAAISVFSLLVLRRT